MNRTTLLIRLTAAALVIGLISSCARDSGQHTHDEIIQLQTELEQLGNQVGRLEFRLFQLEDQLSSQSPASAAGGGSDSPQMINDAITSERTEIEDGHFDLTPVEQ